MANSRIPNNYSLFNAQDTKQIAVVVLIDGVPDILSSIPLKTKIRYGDPEINYGDPGLVYGGLRSVDGVKDIISLDGSSLTISQKIEPEQGRSSISQLTFAFIDENQYMTRLISPGVIVPEILGREIICKIGYPETSYPEDYFQVFRGYITGVNAGAGMVTIQTSDPNVKKRQVLFFQAKTSLTSPINNAVTSIPVASTGDFHKQILGPDASYDPAVTTYIQIDDEVMLYGPAGIASPTSFTVTRGQRGTAAVSHDSGASVSSTIQVEDDAIPMALKLMLSGWNGPWKTGVTASSFVNTTDPGLGNIPGAVVLSTGVDAIDKYGLIEGDTVSITGGANNGVTGIILQFMDANGQPNQIMIIDQPLVVENPGIGTLSFRSQYDVYPTSCGLKLSGPDVDVERHEFYQTTFLPQPENSYRFYLTNSQNGKTFIESEIFLPMGLYSLTRFGRISMAQTRPPIADAKLQFLTQENVINPESIAPSRSTNNRKFFNEINFTFDYADNGNATAISRYLDSDSLSLIGITMALPINSLGGKTDKGIVDVFGKRAQLLLSRFKRGATMLNMDVNWETASLIEAGDVVAVQDDGTLQISNFDTGVRDLETQLFEVIDRKLDIKMGRASLMLISGIGAQSTDRYATISPSSKAATGSTTTEIIIEDSFGAVFPGNEQRKWEDYLGQFIIVHSPDYSVVEQTTLIGFDPSNRYKMLISGLSFSPPAGYIIDIPNYPNTLDSNDNLLYKLVHCFFDPQVVVVSGVDGFNFTVGAGDIAKFLVGAIIRVHDYNYTVDSGDVVVQTVAGAQVTITTDMGFTPAPGQYVDLIGFSDGGFAYRLI